MLYETPEAIVYSLRYCCLLVWLVQYVVSARGEVRRYCGNASCCSFLVPLYCVTFIMAYWL